jgi:hypothetical protein
MAKLLNFRLPSGQSIMLKTADENDDQQTMTALENEFTRMKSDAAQALNAQAEQHKQETATLSKEIETLKSSIASRTVLLRKQASQDPKFDERSETEYYMGLPADRLLKEAKHIEDSHGGYSASLRAPSGNGIFDDGAGMFIE